MLKLYHICTALIITLDTLVGNAVMNHLYRTGTLNLTAPLSLNKCLDTPTTYM